MSGKAEKVLFLIKKMKILATLTLIILFSQTCQSTPERSGMSLTQQWLAKHSRFYSIIELYHLRELDLSYANIRDEDLVYIKNLVNLEILKLNRTQINLSGLRYLSNLEKLTHLELRFTSPRRQNMPWLTRLPLRSLDLSGTTITDTFLPPLVKLTRLRRLALAHTKIGDQALTEMLQQKAMSQLLALDIGYSAIRRPDKLPFPEGLRFLDISGLDISQVHFGSRLPLLQTLIVRGAGVTDEFVYRTGDLKELQFLDLFENGVTDTGALFLEKKTAIISLNLAYNLVSAVSLERFSNNRRMRFLDYSGALLSRSYVHQLRSAPPQFNLQLSHYYPDKDNLLSAKSQQLDKQATRAVVRIDMPVDPKGSFLFQIRLLDQDGAVLASRPDIKNLIFRWDSGAVLPVTEPRVVPDPGRGKGFYNLIGQLQIPVPTRASHLQIFKDKDLLASVPLFYRYSSSNGLLIYTEKDTYNTGEFIFFQAQVFNGDGRPAFGAEQMLDMYIRHPGNFYVNQRKINNRLQITPDDFFAYDKFGVAVFKGRPLRVGLYHFEWFRERLFPKDSWNRDPPVNINGVQLPEAPVQVATFGWNRLQFRVVEGDIARASIDIPANLDVAKEYSFSLGFEDRFHNRFFKPGYQLSITPFIPGKLFLNGKLLTDSQVTLLRSSNSFRSLHAGSLQFSGDGLDFSVRVYPNAAQTAYFETPETVFTEKFFTIEVTLRDQYGNAARPLHPVFLELPPQLADAEGNQQIEVGKANNRFSLIASEEGVFQIRLNGLAGEHLAQLSVLPDPPDYLQIISLAGSQILMPGKRVSNTTYWRGGNDQTLANRAVLDHDHGSTELHKDQVESHFLGRVRSENEFFRVLQPLRRSAIYKNIFVHWQADFRFGSIIFPGDSQAKQKTLQAWRKTGNVLYRYSFSWDAHTRTLRLEKRHWFSQRLMAWKVLENVEGDAIWSILEKSFAVSQ